MATNDYDFDPDAAGHADDVANRIDTSGPYVGTFAYAEKVISAQKGSKGMRLGFDDGHGGRREIALWTHDKDGKVLGGNGYNFVNALMAVMGLKGLKAVKGKVYVWNEETKKQRDLEQDGEVYPDLIGKRVGLFLQKVLKTNDRNGKDYFDMELYGIFHAESKLTSTELKEKKAKPEKFEKMLKSIKDRDARSKKTDEPAQPSLGAEGGF